MSDELSVILGDTIAGTVARRSGGRLRFRYRDDYRERPDATPLSVSMPTPVRSHDDGVVTPWMWGLLPENDAVLQRWARQFQTSASSPFSMLRTPVGHDCPGAVRFSAPEQAEDLIGLSGEVRWMAEEEVADRLAELKRDATAWLGADFTGQFSLAGAQAKTALLFQNGRWGVPSGAAATSHILKPAVAGLDDHDLNEHLCLDAARRVGMLASRTRVVRFGNETAIVVERYDRRIRDGRLVRIHQEDVCQALSVHPSRKYQNEGGPSAADVARLFRRVMPAQVAEDAVWRFLDALGWNWVIAGTDAHAKNYSLLLAGGDVRLAPLYDIASALPYDVHERKLRFAMKLGGDYRVYPHRNPWVRAAADLGLTPDATIERVDELAAAAPDAFRDAASVPDVASLESPLAPRLIDLVADRADRCRKALRSPSTEESQQPNS